MYFSALSSVTFFVTNVINFVLFLNVKPIPTFDLVCFDDPYIHYSVALSYQVTA
jgi:hypothetical protein